MPLALSFADIGQTVGLALQMTDAAYQPAINSAIRAAWAALAAEDDWYFLRQSKPYEMSLNTTDTDYIVAQDEVGTLLYIADVDGKEIAYHRDWYDTKRQRTNIGPGEKPVLFEIAGLTGNHFIIRFDRAWDEAKTGYLHYNEAGSEANINRLPSAWAWVLIHKVKSMVAPPVQIKPDLWQSLTKNEHFLYELGLSKMQVRCSPLYFTRRDDDINPDYLSQIAEAEQ